MTNEFTYDNLIQIVTKLVATLLQLAEIGVVAAIVYYGFRMVVSRGDATAFGAAKKGLGWAIVGGIVIFGVYTIIATVQTNVKLLG